MDVEVRVLSWAPLVPNMCAQAPSETRNLVAPSCSQEDTDARTVASYCGFRFMHHPVNVREWGLAPAHSLSDLQVRRAEGSGVSAAQGLRAAFRGEAEWLRTLANAMSMHRNGEALEPGILSSPAGRAHCPWIRQYGPCFEKPRIPSLQVPAVPTAWPRKYACHFGMAALSFAGGITLQDNDITATGWLQPRRHLRDPVKAQQPGGPTVVQW